MAVPRTSFSLFSVSCIGAQIGTILQTGLVEQFNLVVGLLAFVELAQRIFELLDLHRSQILTVGDKS